MSAELSHIPNYQEVVPDPADRLRQTRASISPRSLSLLEAHVPGLAGVTRFPVPDDKVSWDVPFSEYDPPFVDAPYGRLTGKDADTVFDGVPEGLVSWEGPIRFDDDGHPLNPAGRTGLIGRLTMNHEGPTPAADGIVTRTTKEGERQVLMVVRTDNGLVALPAGKLDSGETALEAVTRETYEETGMMLDFSRAKVIFSGVVDDDRATDWAWFETTAFRLALTGSEDEVGPKPKLKDVVRAEWMPAQEALTRPSHASTRLMLNLAFSRLQ